MPRIIIARPVDKGTVKGRINFNVIIMRSNTVTNYAPTTWLPPLSPCIQVAQVLMLIAEMEGTLPFEQ
jgi:hypothetical protein